MTKKVSNNDLPAHSPLGGSGAKRWSECPASGRLAATLPPKPTTDAAEEGTRAHECAEGWLKTGIAPLGLDEETFNAIEVFVDTVMRIHRQYPDAELMVEQKFRLYDIEPDDVPMFGSADAVVYIPSQQKLHVFDYKHGVGLPVQVHGNEQLLYYALGVWYSLGRKGVEEITMWVVQPRCLTNKSGPVNHWTINIEELEEFEEMIIASVNEVMTNATEFKPGPWCRFCPASGACTAQRKQALKDCQVEMNMSGEFIMSEPNTIDDQELADIHTNLPQLKQWILRVEEEAMARNSRKPLPGMKLVAGRRRRQWNCDIEDVREALLDMFAIDSSKSMIVKPISPAQLEKIIGKEAMIELAEFIEWTEAAPRLVPVNDPRPALNRDIDDAMEGLKNAKV